MVLRSITGPGFQAHFESAVSGAAKQAPSLPTFVHKATTVLRADGSEKITEQVPQKACRRRRGLCILRRR